MLDYEKLKKLNVISRRMCIIDDLCRQSGFDIYYLFGLLNMYNAKNKGKWFWQKAVFTGTLKDDFNNFNNHMDKFTSGFRSLSEDKIKESLSRTDTLLLKLVQNLEASLCVNRETDTADVKAYLDDNIKSLIDQGLRDYR